MAAVAQRVEGYKIVSEFKGDKGFIGAEGADPSWPAFNIDAALAYIEELLKLAESSKVTYTLQIIDGARYVRSTSGEVVDNDEPVVRMNT